jgi:hypothetical protein
VKAFLLSSDMRGGFQRTMARRAGLSTLLRASSLSKRLEYLGRDEARPSRTLNRRARPEDAATHGGTSFVSSHFETRSPFSYMPP